MSSHSWPGIPPLAGVCSFGEAVRPGYSVDETVRLLKRYNHLKTRLMQVASSHICATPIYEVKAGLTLHMHLDAEHSSTLRRRVSEMREPPHELDVSPDPALTAFTEEVLRAQSDVELLTGIYQIVRPALLAAFRRHLVEQNRLTDHPTYRVLRFITLEEEEMIAWGQAAAAALITTPDREGEAGAWQEHLEAYLSASGGVRGDETKPLNPLPTPRSLSPFEIDIYPHRDHRFINVHNDAHEPDAIYLDPTVDPVERVFALYYKRIREIDVPEMMAVLIAQTPGKPWEYYVEMTRQAWDEARHALMGEVGFFDEDVDWTKAVIQVNFSYALNKVLTPLQRHGILYHIEQGLMPVATGKRYEWKLAQEAGKELSAAFQDYDWADEVLHAQIGRRWYCSELGGVQQGLAFAREALAKSAAFRATLPNEAWWKEFYNMVRHQQAERAK